jgi:hypothetical protein
MTTLWADFAAATAALIDCVWSSGGTHRNWTFVGLAPA